MQNALSDQFQDERRELTPAFQGFDRMDVSMLGLLPDGKIVYANRSACEMMGFPHKELIGVSIKTVAPEMTAEKWSALWSAIDQNGFSEEHATLMLQPPGQKEFQVGCKAVRIQSDNLKGCVLFLAEPGKVPTAAVNIKEHRAQLVQILDAMGNPVIVMDPHHKFTFLNKDACRLFGTTLAEATGKTFHDYFPVKSADMLQEKAQAVQASGAPATYVGNDFLRAKYGESITLLPFFDSGTFQKRVIAIINKISEPEVRLPALRPQPDAPLQNRSQKTDAAELYRSLETGAVGIGLKDTGNRFVWMNRSFAAMLGFKPEELIGKPLEEVINDSDLMAELRKEDEAVYATGRPLFNLEKHPLGDLTKVHRVDKIPFIDKAKKVAGIIVLAVELDRPLLKTEALKEELKATARKLEETETALRVVLEHKESSTSLNSEKTGEKIKTLILPYLENLKQTDLKTEQTDYVQLMEENLKYFYDPHFAKLAAPECRLSPTELKVAQLVRDGKTNKEIAEMLHLSKSTILTHRHHVRVKLGIRNKKVNLRSLLKS
jgi:PAS domain S-box-containing protein